MKILVLSHEYPPIGGGGANACYFLSHQFAQAGHQVTIVTAQYSHLAQEEKTTDGVLIFRVRCKRSNKEKSSFIEMCTYFISAWQYTDKLLKTTSFDKCLVFFGFPSGPIALHLKNKYRLPYIIRFGGGDIPGAQKRFKYIYKILSPILRKIWKNADNLIANSEGLYARALKFESRYNINIIENGVDNQFFIPREESRDINQVQILFVSRLIEGKGLQYIIPYMSRIHEEVFQKCKKDVKLIVVGDGPYKTKLEELAERTHTIRYIEFVGRKNKEQVRKYYQSTDVFILPSLSEGMPNVVLEAMSCGLPIVMTPCEGSKELVTDNGFISKIETFPEILIKVCTDVQMREQMGKNSIYHIKTNFEWKMIAQRYIQILENKKIAVVISSLRKGGAERIVSDLTLNLPQNWDIDIILNSSKENIEYSFRGNIITLGMKPQKNKLDIMYQYNVLIKRIFLLKKLKKKNNYAVCISFMDSANVANILSGKKYCKVIGTVHTYLKAIQKPQYKYLVKPLIKHFYNKADKIVGVSNDITEDLINTFGIHNNKVLTIHNGIDINKIRSLSQENLDESEKVWFDNSENVIVTMGRLELVKAQWHIIRAMKDVKKEFNDARLIILGEGSLRENLESMTEMLGLKESVIFCGAKDNPFKIISRSQIFVMSSMYEGFSQALLEAMCCGVPCVATDFKTSEVIDPNREVNSPVRDITYAGYGIITPMCDGKMRKEGTELTNEEKKLSDAIIVLLHNKQLQEKYIQLGKKRSESLSIQRSVKQYIKLMNE